MAYTITIRIPVEAYEKCGVDRDKFLENVKKNAQQYFKQRVEVEINKTPAKSK